MSSDAAVSKGNIGIGRRSIVARQGYIGDVGTDSQGGTGGFSGTMGRTVTVDTAPTLNLEAVADSFTQDGVVAIVAPKNLDSTTLVRHDVVLHGVDMHHTREEQEGLIKLNGPELLSEAADKALCVEKPNSNDSVLESPYFSTLEEKPTLVKTVGDSISSGFLAPATSAYKWKRRAKGQGLHNHLEV